MSLYKTKLVIYKDDYEKLRRERTIFKQALIKLSELYLDKQNVYSDPENMVESTSDYMRGRDDLANEVSDFAESALKEAKCTNQ